MRRTRTELLATLQAEGLLFDGAMGTLLDARRGRLPAFDCPERLVLEAPETIREIHRDYLAVGADVVTTCTFGGTPHKLGLHGLEPQARAVNLAAARLAGEAAAAFPGALVAGSMGPTGLLSIERRTDFQDFYRNFHVQAAALLAGGVDLLLLETCNDMMETRAGILASRDAMAQAGRDALLVVSFSTDALGNLLLGTHLAAAALVVDHLGVDMIGLNCSMGPDEMYRLAGELHRLVAAPLLAMPNRGLPRNVGGRPVFDLPAADFARKTAAFRGLGFRSLGGCCGTDPDCIRALRAEMAAAPLAPETPRERVPALTGLFEAMVLATTPRPILVGERLNYHGSRKFRNAVDANDMETVVQLARVQVERGARVLDLNLATRDVQRQMELVRQVIPQVSLNAPRPLMVDSTDLDAMREACRRMQGRGVLNSCNLEDLDKCREILALARRHGMMVVCLPLAGEGLPRQPEERLRNARRLCELAEAAGLSRQDLILDPLILTLGTGQPEDRDNGRQALETLRLFKAELPGCFTVMGVSNVSYGLPAAFRPVLNNVLLHHAGALGLDFAIFNPMELMHRTEIPADRWDLAEDLLLNRRPDALHRVLEIGHAPLLTESVPDAGGDALTLPERLRRQIVRRDRHDFLPRLEEAARQTAPQTLIETVFLPAMAEVGRLMESRGLPLPYVLESAAITQEGLQHLKRHFPFQNAAGRGRIVLATVKGDVHDIGKNLVRMLMAHNGFDVADLGADVAAERILAAVREGPADMVGLSALLVSTSREMRRVVELLHRDGLEVPVLVGGAAVSDAYARELGRLDGETYPGGVFYGRDAFHGLRLAEELADPARRRDRQRRFAEECRSAAAIEAPAAPTPVEAAPVPAAPLLDPAVRVFCVDVARMIRDFNFEKQCGRKLMAGARMEKGFYESLLRTGEKLLRELGHSSLVAPMAALGLFELTQTGDGGLTIVHGGRRLPLSLAPACWARLIRCGGKPMLPLLVVTLGGTVSETVRQHFDGGDYLQGYILSTIAAELADELAEVATVTTLAELGLPRAGVVRYSPGYPVWPALQDQRILFDLLGAEAHLGVTLSEAFQMIPEYSVSAGLLRRDRESDGTSPVTTGH
ncbi:MAG TPA: homocysteine S-methyltransferase family protein [Acidobacteriota bacterium]|nr:homocysteine S-methyltransferase family protein [Acidobacteriota bacterium]HNU01681.1 homocysteine S-methyltransferase family protein [Acidobacteriota bacterium]